MPQLETPVLVVGAGLAGLATAVFLGHHGVPALVVERHPSTSTQPKARGQNPVAMEALRTVGLAGAVLDAAPPGRGEMTIVIARSVAGEVLHSFTEHGPDFSRHSPAPFGLASQAVAERLLAERARELGARLCFGTALEDLAETPDGVTATLRDLASGAEHPVRAAYAVGADGHRGAVRERVGIGVHGRGTFDRTTTVRFTADLDGVVADTAVLMYYLQNPDLPGGNGVLVSTDTRGEYVAGMAPPADDAAAVAAIRTLTGVDDLAVTVLDSSTWDIAHRVADRFARGRVLLVGDTAHLMPPTGGQGGNTALLDGYHLAWRLAAVLRGQAGPALLDTWDPERRPYAGAVCDWQFANMVVRQAPHLRGPDTPEPMDPVRLAFGYCAPTGAFCAEPEGGPLFDDPEALRGRPGSRAPHVPLRGAARSTRDLVGSGWALLTTDPGWAAPAARAGIALDVALDVHVVTGEEDTDAAFESAYGLHPGGASLVRPDGVVGWRGAGAPDGAAVEAALRHILAR
jgi:putative polyketide hydroxylase